MKAPQTLPIRGDSIELGQAVKLAGLAETGGEAKALVQAGRVRVNGQVDTRRGRRLVVGDVVGVQGRTFRVVAGG